MDITSLTFLPSADRPMLVGLLVDVSASMLSSIQNSSGQSKNRLESFRDSFKELATKGQAMSQQGIAGAFAPLVKVFAYGFGFGNPLSILMGDKGPKVRDLLALSGEQSSTVPIDRLSREWPRYQEHLEQQVTKVFGDTPMATGFRMIRERFKTELSSGNYSSLQVLFVLSDGDPTDGSLEEVAELASQIKDEGILIISCYVTDQDITEPRHLYGIPSPSWPLGAQLMFKCASALPKDSPFEMYLREYQWKFEPEGRLFTQINQSDVLSEFLNLVLSPLQKVKELETNKIDQATTKTMAPESRQVPEVATSKELVKPVEETNIPVRIFVSYSHHDAKYLESDSLIGYLSGLAREGFDFWHDERIVASELWDERLRSEIQRADIALILVSQAFLNSRYCQDVEITNFLVARKESGLKILPIILSPCDWKSYHWLVSTQFLPRGGQTIETDFKVKGKRDSLYLEILEALRKVGEQVRKQRLEKTSKAIGNFLGEIFDR